MGKLSGRRILFLATDRFEESELFGPRESLMAEGAQVELASIDRDEIYATVIDEPGRRIKPDLTLDEVRPDDFDALVLPGGVGNPDRLRMEPKAVAIIRAFDAVRKPVAAICHGPWLLVEADVVRGRRIACWPSIRTDVRNAGGEIVDQDVVVDGHLITSRKPEDVPAFSAAIIDSLQS